MKVPAFSNELPHLVFISSYQRRPYNQALLASSSSGCKLTGSPSKSSVCAGLVPESEEASTPALLAPEPVGASTPALLAPKSEDASTPVLLAPKPEGASTPVLLAPNPEGASTPALLAPKPEGVSTKGWAGVPMLRGLAVATDILELEPKSTKR